MLVSQQGTKINVKSEISVDIELSPNDIYNWILAHTNDSDLAMLRALEKQLKSVIRAIESPDTDDYHSII